MALWKKKNEQDEQIIRALKPQSRIDLILSQDLLRDRVDMRSAIVYDIDNTHLIISQTTVPVLKSMIGRAVEVTFLVPDKEGSGPRRFGFTTHIRELILDYRLRRGDTLTQQALLLDPPKGSFFESNIRMDYRVRILPDFGVTIKLGGTFGPVQLVDLSRSGAMVGIQGSPQVTDHQIIPFVLFSRDEEPIRGEAEVRRIIWNPKAGRMHFLGLKFVKMDAASMRILHRLSAKVMLLELRKSREREEEI